MTPHELHEEVIWRSDAAEPGCIALVAGYLVVLLPYDTPHVLVLSAADGRPRCAFGTNGGGPGEFRFPESVLYEEEARRVSILDPNLSRISQIPVDSLCDSHQPVTVTLTTPSPSIRGLLRAGNGQYLAYDNSGKGLIYESDPTGTQWESLGEPLSIPGTPNQVAAVVNMQSGTLNPRTGMLAMAGIRTGTLRLYTRQGALVDTIVTPNPLQPHFMVGSSHHNMPSMIPDSTDRYGYLSSASNDRYIALLYSGHRRGSGNIILQGRDLQMYDWNGCLVGVFRLQAGIGSIAINWRTMTLYGGRKGESAGVVRAQLPAPGMCQRPTSGGKP